MMTTLYQTGTLKSRKEHLWFVLDEIDRESIMCKSFPIMTIENLDLGEIDEAMPNYADCDANCGPIGTR